jgi:hypothetical protein
LSSRAWLGALAAIVVGAAAGYFVSHPLPLTRTLFAILYAPVQSLIGGWLVTSDRFLVSTAVISALPTIVVLGLALGVLLPRLRYPRLLMYALLLWPLWFAFSRLLGWRAVAGHDLDLQANFFAYSLLFLVIVATRAVARPRKPAR